MLAARKLNEIGARPCPALECAISDAIDNAKRILEKIEERWLTQRTTLSISLVMTPKFP